MRAILHRIGGMQSVNMGVAHVRVILIMTSSSHSFLAQIRRLGAFLAASLRKSLKMEPHDGDFASQRMCPFCGLITPRHESCCLECGKAFKAA